MWPHSQHILFTMFMCINKLSALFFDLKVNICMKILVNEFYFLFYINIIRLNIYLFCSFKYQNIQLTECKQKENFYIQRPCKIPNSVFLLIISHLKWPMGIEEVFNKKVLRNKFFIVSAVFLNISFLEKYSISTKYCDFK